jgi:hypothetical protein
MNKQHVAEQNVYLKDKSFDYALPQPWVDEIAEIVPYNIIIFCFVWLYDGDLFGRPYPINMGGWVACKVAGIEWC